MTSNVIEIGSPWFDELQLGQVFADAPAVTLTTGHAAFHGAAYGDRLRLALDAELSSAVTGEQEMLVNPNVVCNVAIGQTTFPSGRVLGNLFYRGVVLERPVFIGDTLRTTTTIAALRQNRPKPGRKASGMAVFEMLVENQRGETVMRFWRCPMLPCKDPEAETGHADSFDAFEDKIDLAQVRRAVPAEWKLDQFRSQLAGDHFEEIPEDTRYVIEGRDTVTCAPEITRLTLNIAKAHTDAGAAAQGRRLVYGGHTISTAGAQITRALPNLVTLLAWRSCDHTAPVFEYDILRTELEIVEKHPLAGEGGLVDFRASVFAERAAGSESAGEEVQVLDWRAIGLMA